MIPKVEITYSNIYDIVLSKSKRIKYSRKRLIEGERFANKLQKSWNKHSSRILILMSKLTGLKWQKSYIECFVTFNTPYPFSHSRWLYNSAKKPKKLVKIEGADHLFVPQIHRRKVIKETVKWFKKWLK